MLRSGCRGPKHYDLPARPGWATCETALHRPGDSRRSGGHPRERRLDVPDREQDGNLGGHTWPGDARLGTATSAQSCDDRAGRIPQPGHPVWVHGPGKASRRTAGSPWTVDQHPPSPAARLDIDFDSLSCGANPINEGRTDRLVRSGDTATSMSPANEFRARSRQRPPGPYIRRLVSGENPASAAESVLIA